MQEAEEAVDLANQVLEMKPDSYEAYYARAKANLDLKLYDCAQCDIREALQLAPVQNLEVKKVLAYLRDEIASKMSVCTSRMTNHRDLAVSVDMLHE